MDPKIYLFFLFGFTANVPNVSLHLFYAMLSLKKISGWDLELVSYMIVFVIQNELNGRYQRYLDC